MGVNWSVEKLVFETYPVTKDEKCCALKKQRMEAKREALRKRLINEWQGKDEIPTKLPPSKSEV